MMCVQKFWIIFYVVGGNCVLSNIYFSSYISGHLGYYYPIHLILYMSSSIVKGYKNWSKILDNF